jgi:hypothetical protein
MGGSSLNSKNIAASNFQLAVALGNVPGVKGITRTGFNSTITNTPEDIWTVGGQQVYLDAAEIINIVSTDVDDNSTGTGLQTLRIFGLDNNFDEVEEDVIMNGLTIVPTVNSYIRVHDLIGISAGSSGNNEGDITATASIDGSIQNEMLGGGNASQSLQYTIPNGKTGGLTTLTFSDAAGDAMIFSLFTRPFGGLFTIQNVEQIVGGTFEYTFDPYPGVSEKTDVRIIANQSAGGGGTTSSAILQLYVVDN